MAEPATSLMSVEEFFAWQERQDELYELVDGRPVPRAMTGATQRHDRVVVNAIAAFHAKLRGGPCRPMTADVATRTRDWRVRRPDMTVDCDPMNGGSVTSNEPVLILEVLSPSTERIDTLVKVDEYKALSSLRYILFAEPGAAHVLLYARGGDGAWTDLDHTGLDTTIELPAIECSISLAELYEDVPLASDVEH